MSAPATALVLAGGLGTRMGALGERRPKCLLPLGEGTVLQRQLAQIARAGAERAAVSIAERFAPALQAALDGWSLPLPTAALPERERLGPVGGLLAMGAAAPGPALVVLGDVVWTEADPFGALVARAGGPVVVGVAAWDDPADVDCAVAFDADGAVLSIQERPRPDQLAGPWGWGGAFTLGPGGLAALAEVHRRRPGSRHLGDLMERARLDGVAVSAAPIGGRVINVNRASDLELAAGLL